MDLIQEAEVAAMFQEVDKHFEPVQVAVVNHGYWLPEDVLVVQMTLGQWNSMISTALRRRPWLCGSTIVLQEGLRFKKQGCDRRKRFHSKEI